MKFVKTFFVIVFSLSTINAFATDIDEVLQKYVDILGGRELMDSVNSELAKGKFEVMGFSGNILIYTNKDLRMLIVNVQIGEGDPRSVLMRDYISPDKAFTFQMGTTVNHSAEEIETRLRNALDENIYKLAVGYKELGYSAEMEAVETELGNVYNITFSKNGEPKKLLVFDAHSGYLIRSEDYENELSVNYSDYKEVGSSGLTRPFKLKQKIKNFVTDITIEEILFNQPEPEGLSEVPEQ